MARYNLFRNLWNAAWLFPLKGVFYFAAHTNLYPLFSTRLIPIALLSTFVLATLFVWAYLPLVAFLAIFHGKGAWLNAVFIILGLGATVVAILFEAFFVDETMVDVFDAVLVMEGLSDLVGNARAVDAAEPNAVRALGKPTKPSAYAPFSLRQIVELILLLPVNLIPWVGVPIFLFLTGYRAGPFNHWRYFQLLDFSKKERKAYIKQRKLRYTWFGTVALILQLIPVLNMLFLLTTATGSALWAVQMEKVRRAKHAYTPDGPEPYHDEAA